MAWGQKVSQTFRDRITWTADALGVELDYLMAVMAFETGETFSASVRNGAGSGATGLIQFMPATARGMGTTTDALAAMSAEDQIAYVYRYLLPYKGRMRTLSDVYMAVLWPAAIGKPESAPLWTQAERPTTYRQNAGLDGNRDGTITKAEAAGKVREKLERGLMPLYAWTGAVHPSVTK
ncbi:lytic transglycosylase [Achromobacter sp. GG226]|nr:lytic transglycosylase [Verticiella sp. GG226]